MKTLELNTGVNGLETWRAIYRSRVQLQLNDAAWTAIANAHKTVETIVAGGDAVYGINSQCPR